MKNYWIAHSISRKFERLQNYIKGQWVGLNTYYRSIVDGHLLTVGIKVDPPFEIKGSPPPAFQQTVHPKAHHVGIHIAYIYLKNVNDWEIRVPVLCKLTNTMHWKTVRLPNNTDPAYLLRIEQHVDKAIEDFKKQQEEKRKCEESSSS